MELKTARLTLLVDPNKKAAFERLCAQQDRTPSQVVRQLIRDYLAAHGVEYVASGFPPGKAEPAEAPALPRAQPRPKTAAAPTSQPPTQRAKGPADGPTKRRKR